ncbi:trehalose transport system permease protein SugB [Peptococcaceae bacterium CEB3]|nr:trehalose transport system permease protein SugB [Peptococcaceae bacterium CEB3]
MFERTFGFRVFYYTSLILVGFFVLFPLYWMINTALNPSPNVFSIQFLPLHATLNNFIGVLENGSIMRYLANSLMVSIATSFVATVVAAYAGYSFSKFRYAGRKSLMLLIMTSQMFPQVALLLTLYLMMKAFGLLNTYLALVISYVSFTLPVGTWTLKAYFDQIPNSLIESAKLDGAGQMKIIHRIIFPLAVPGLASTAIYGFVWSWNDLLYSLTLITSNSKRTLGPGLVLTYMGQFQSNWNSMMAASIVVSIPVTVMFIFLQRYFIQGLTAGAVKG